MGRSGGYGGEEDRGKRSPLAHVAVDVAAIGHSQVDVALGALVGQLGVKGQRQDQRAACGLAHLIGSGGGGLGGDERTKGGGGCQEGARKGTKRARKGTEGIATDRRALLLLLLRLLRLNVGSVLREVGRRWEMVGEGGSRMASDGGACGR